MANLVSFADGNFSGASTFRSIDTTLSATTWQLTQSQNTSTTTQSSPAITAVSNTIEGVLLYLKANTGQSGTLTVTLQDNTPTPTTLQSVTVNWSDMPLVPTIVFFKFGAAQAVTAGHSIVVTVQSSVNAAFTMYLNSSTANDWFRLLRLNSSATAAAGDVTWIAGDWTAQATFATRTVTMDVTTATSTNFGQFTVGSKGIFTWGVQPYASNGNVNYRLRISSGVKCTVTGHGTLQMGTASNPIPPYITATLDFESAGNGSSGLENRGGTVNTYGSQLKQCWITNKALTTNVATLTTATNHGFFVGESVVVSGVGSPFDGTWTVASVPTATTFTYADTSSNVGSAAATGVASIQVSITNMQLSSNIATLTTSQAHGFLAGEYVTITGVDTSFNGTFLILSVPTTTTFCYSPVQIFQQNIINHALTSNVVTLTFASYHNWLIGDPIVVVDNTDSTLNGNFTITGVTPTTITYSLTHANVTSAAATGVVTQCPNIPIVYKSLTSNVATLQTKYPHGFAASESVVVAGVDATFNGTFSISLNTTGVFVNPSTFNYSVTASNITRTQTFNNLGTVAPANITSQAASGTATITKAPTFAYLSQDLASGNGTAAGSVHTNIITNWVGGSTVGTGQNLLGNGDALTLAPTFFASNQTERFKALSVMTLTGANTGTAFSVSANTSQNHTGNISTNQDYRAEIFNVTRNVKITGAVGNTVGTASGTTGYFWNDEAATTSLFYTEFEWMGSNSAGSVGYLANSPFSASLHSLGLRCNTTSAPVAGSATIGNCSFHDNNNDFGIIMEVAQTSNTASLRSVDNVLIQNCVFDNFPFSAIRADANNVTGLNIFIDNVISTRCGNSSGGDGTIRTEDNGMCVSNVNAIGGNVGLDFNESCSNANYNGNGIWTNIVTHSCDAANISMQAGNNYNINMSNVRSWRANNTTGLLVGDMYDCLFDFIQCYNNGSIGIQINASQNTNVVFRNVYCDLGSTQFGNAPSQITGFYFNASSWINFYIINGQFGANQQHTTADFGVNANTIGLVILCNNVALNSPTPIQNFTYNSQTNFTTGNKFGFTRYGQVAGNHRTVYLYGTITSDTSIFKTASPSERLSPTALTPSLFRLKLESSPKRVALLNGQNTTVGVWVRQSVSGDGATYNGQFPQLILKANPGAGILTDQLIATGTTSGQGSFEQLTGLTPTVSDDAVLEFVVQCNGTVGWVNVDDWTAT